MIARAGALALLAGIIAVGGAAAQQAASPPTVYGYVKFDASWDEALVSAGNFARWVISPEHFEPHAHFNMTARQTRLGLRFEQPRGSASLQGRVELDFYGGGAENKNSVQARHAFIEVTWPSGWELLAGQTSDVISPLVPSTLNYTVAWWSGNVGYRRPQFRVSKVTRIGPVDVRLDGAATRTIGDDFGATEPGDTGSDSGRPTAQGRVALTLPAHFTVGAHVHRGTERLHTALSSGPVSIATSSWGVDVTVTHGRLMLKYEAWEGANMDDHFGGIGQGLRHDETSVSAISGRGGWVELSALVSGLRLSAGAGTDDPDDEDLLRGFRSRNASQWVTGVRDFGQGLQAGLEVSRWRTEYVGFLPGSSMRAQMSVIYSF